MIMMMMMMIIIIIGTFRLANNNWICSVSFALCSIM